MDGVKDTALRSQLAAFLTALGLATSAAKGGEEGAPRGFRCRRGGGRVLQGVAALMDERDLAGPPSLDGEAAFDAAKEVSKRALNGLRCSRCRSQIKNTGVRILGFFCHVRLEVSTKDSIFFRHGSTPSSRFTAIDVKRVEAWAFATRGYIGSLLWRGVRPLVQTRTVCCELARIGTWPPWRR